jgi:hypothetical protein
MLFPWQKKPINSLVVVPTLSAHAPSVPCFAPRPHLLRIRTPSSFTHLPTHNQRNTHIDRSNQDHLLVSPLKMSLPFLPGYNVETTMVCTRTPVCVPLLIRVSNRTRSIPTPHVLSASRDTYPPAYSHACTTTQQSSCVSLTRPSSYLTPCPSLFAEEELRKVPPLRRPEWRPRGHQQGILPLSALCSVHFALTLLFCSLSVTP